LGVGAPPPNTPPPRGPPPPLSTKGGADL
jgi:hypothetical protein